LPIVGEHHEWFNGKGYPYRISGQDISLDRRIFAGADVHDALVSGRPYRQGMPLGCAFSILRDSSGTQFDPQIVDAFFANQKSHSSITIAVPQRQATPSRY
jgi:HD-GYP domain-containing protein (c-di-GMP phosphodiesterase class II)